jgi:AcrR family transcriptional regulator
MSLFLRQGFEVTTVDQIVLESGISRRSFFRYFGTKEDIVFTTVDSCGPALLESLRTRPDDEDIWDALHAATAILRETLQPTSGKAHARLIAASPALRGRLLQKHDQWIDALVPEVERRLGHDTAPHGVRARAIVGTVLTCLNAATEVWLTDGDGRTGSSGLETLYATALDAVRGTSDR